MWTFSFWPEELSRREVFLSPNFHSGFTWDSGGLIYLSNTKIKVLAYKDNDLWLKQMQTTKSDKITFFIIYSSIKWNYKLAHMYYITDHSFKTKCHRRLLTIKIFTWLKIFLNTGYFPYLCLHLKDCPVNAHKLYFSECN